jgi:hypothetical protein
MRLPGFTAEKALQNVKVRHTGVAIAARAQSQAVIPQFWRCVGNTCCDPWSGACYYCHPWLGFCWPIRHPVLHA